MPRKPKLEKTTITVVANGSPIAVMLHPPSGRKRNWYAYWNGLKFSKSTGCKDRNDAIIVAEKMVRNGGRQPKLSDNVLSDAEFELIQRTHFKGKKDQERAVQSLESCLHAISAFRLVMGLSPITIATPDDCARFQRLALELPKNWRRPYANGDDGIDRLSANTVLKWSRSLQAAFERANRNALRRKCVRGVVEESKLLTSNPWHKITWIEGHDSEIRQFESDELLSFLQYLENGWPTVSVALSLAKTHLWSWGRKSEVAGLTWSSSRDIGNEHHFRSVGKRGVEKWFRLPMMLCEELRSIRTESDFVFAAYVKQLQRHYRKSGKPHLAVSVSNNFEPRKLGNWLYRRIADWSETLPNGHASTHVFRKTTLQYARSGEDSNRDVANDASITESVMMTNYVCETDVELRHKSNRTYQRIIASLRCDVATQYGYAPTEREMLEEKLQAALAAKNWTMAEELLSKLKRLSADGERT